MPRRKKTETDVKTTEANANVTEMPNPMVGDLTQSTVIPESQPVEETKPQEVELDETFEMNFELGQALKIVTVSNETFDGIVTYVTDEAVWLKPTRFASGGFVVGRDSIACCQVLGKESVGTGSQFLIPGAAYNVKIQGGVILVGILQKLGRKAIQLANGQIVPMKNIIYIR